MPRLPESLWLHDEGVVLRDWTERDAPAIEPVCGKLDVCQFSTVPREYSPSAARARIDRQRDRRASGSGIALLPANASSHAVAARLGADRACLRPDSHLAGGRHWDTVIYSLTPLLLCGPGFGASARS